MAAFCDLCEVGSDGHHYCTRDIQETVTYTATQEKDKELKKKYEKLKAENERLRCAMQKISDACDVFEMFTWEHTAKGCIEIAQKALK